MSHHFLLSDALSPSSDEAELIVTSSAEGELSLAGLEVIVDVPVHVGCFRGKYSIEEQIVLCLMDQV